MVEKTKGTDERQSGDLQVVLFGATGFTGVLTAEYLAQRAKDVGLRWAIAGRSRTKLEALRQRFAGQCPKGAEPQLIVADSGDRASLEAMAARTSVVCTTVGPYSAYGSELVAACVANGTHYCDITGEVPFIRRMIDEHHETAADVGARIVHCCGFDSIPSDLGTLVVQEHALATYGTPCSDVRLYVRASKGGFSGGTVASMLQTFEQVEQDKEVGRILANPYALNPEGEREGPDGPDQKGVEFDETGDCWTAPFMMAGINTRIVRRSNALFRYRYGRDFRYREVTAFPRGLRGRLRATGAMAGMAAFGGALMLPLTRAALKRFALPSPGEGPSPEAIEDGFFKIVLVGQVGDRQGLPQTVQVVVKGERDPGYGETAKMLGESALCLAFDGDRLKSPGGVLTPASAMGMVLVERLRAAGMTFRIES